MIEPVWQTEAEEGPGSPWRSSGPVSVAFAAGSDLRFNSGRAKETWVPPAGTFAGLDIADRQVLSDWLDHAGGIDNVIDLAVRPWNIPGVAAVLGVFETGKNQASWLIVRYGPGWTLARCMDSSVSDISDSLPDILYLIDEQRGG
jgi:hypothetical protein